MSPSVKWIWGFPYVCRYTLGVGMGLEVAERTET